MPDYSDDDISMIRALLRKYISARGYYDTRRGRPMDTRLSKELGCHKSYVSKILNPSEPLSISYDVALRFAKVLRFGEVSTDHPDIDESDFDAWVAATHIEEYIDQLDALTLDREAHNALYRARQLTEFSLPWARSRWHELRFEYYTAHPLLEEALSKARAVHADEFLGIMLQDFAECSIALGDMKRGVEQAAESEFIYRRLGERGYGHKISVQLGLGRALVQRFFIAVWSGESIDECDYRFRQALTIPTQIEDHYGLAKAHMHRGWLFFLEGDLDTARQAADKAWQQAKHIQKFRALEEMDVYWAIRDGFFFGSTWQKAHAQALFYDIRAQLHLKTGLSLPGYSLDSLPQRMMRPRWLRPIPPVYPFYSWLYEYVRKARPLLNRELQSRVQQLHKLGFLEWVPLAAVAYGDFLSSVADIADAKSYYSAAVAGSAAFPRLTRLAQDRLRSLMAIHHRQS